MKTFLLALFAIIILYLCRDKPEKPVPPALSEDFYDWLGNEFILPAVQREARREYAVLEYPNNLFDILPTHVAQRSVDTTQVTLYFSIVLKRPHACTLGDISKSLASSLRRTIAKKFHIDIAFAPIQSIRVIVKAIPDSSDCDLVIIMNAEMYQYLFDKYQASQTFITY